MNDIRTPATPFQKCESGNFSLNVCPLYYMLQDRDYT